MWPTLPRESAVTEGDQGGVLWGPRDMVKTGLSKAQSSDGECPHPSERRL